MKRVIFALLLLAPAAFAQEEEPGAESAKPAATSSVENKAPETAAPSENSDAPAAEASATESSATTATKKDTGDAVYRSKILELQGRVNNLKEKIFRTKTRLAILKENVLSKTIAGAEAKLVHQNDMGASYVLEKIVYSLDGTPLFSRVDLDGALDDQEEIEIFNGPIVPGSHTLSVMMVYRGNGFGVFSYLKGYVYTLRSSHTFHAEEGKRVSVKTVAYEKGTITTDHRDRPDIRFESVLSEPARGNTTNRDG